MLGHRLESEETDRALTALSNACRRRLLFELYESPDSGDNAPVSYTDIPPLGTESNRLVLYHVHLPKLEEFGYVGWDRTEKTLRRGPRWAEIEPLLELIHSNLRELPPFLRGRSPDRNGTKG